MNVVMVSADTDYRDIYTLGLRHAGFSAKSIGSVEDVPQVLRHFRVEALIFHFAEESEAGWVQCRTLTEIAPRKPVVLLTSWIHPRTPNAQKAFELGVAGVVIEPCLPGDLADIIEKVVRGDRNVEWPMTGGRD